MSIDELIQEIHREKTHDDGVYFKAKEWNAALNRAIDILRNYKTQEAAKTQEISSEPIIETLRVAIEDHLEWMQNGKVDGVGFCDSIAEEALIDALRQAGEL
jgi:hypothetical protein